MSVSRGSNVARALAAAAVVLAPAVARAHPLSAHAASAAARWTPDVGPLAATLALAAVYALGVRRLWARAGRGRGVRVSQVRAFAVAIVVLLVALVSPFDAVADALFSAHMAQHLALILVAAPLLALGNAPLALAWAPPRTARRTLARWWNASTTTRRALRGTTHAVATPAAAWLLHAVALIAWHVPALYAAALREPAVHALEHVSFLGTAWLFWWRVAQPSGRRALGEAAGILYVMSMGLLGSAMGALLTFSSTAWYPVHADGARAWHTTLVADQQLAGLVMWVPAGLVYVGAALALAARWMLTDERRSAVAAERGMRSAHALGAATATLLVLVAVSACESDARHEARAVGGDVASSGELAGIEGGAHLAPDPARGERAIRTYGCGSCHTIPGVRGADGMVGPPLTGWSKRTIIAGYVPNTPERLVQWIVMPQSVAPGNAMPNLGVTDGDARDIAAYLYSLQ
ncbi:MAG TPA: cytochrome c oxidase assembly protein [Gemmatirosa sp.]